MATNEIKLEMNEWKRNNHGFGLLSIGLQEVCCEPVIDLIDVLLESFEVIIAIDGFIFYLASKHEASFEVMTAVDRFIFYLNL